MKKLLTFTVFLAIIFDGTSGTSSVRPSSDLERIIGGSPAYPYEMPYQVALYMDSGALCGGSLISYTCGLTAAHCFYRATYADVLYGTNYLNGTTTRRTNELIRHPDFNIRRPVYDIALFKFDRITPSWRVRPIFLPTAAELDYLFVGHQGQISGWGITSDGATVPSNNLQRVRVTVTSNAVCQTYSPYPIQDSHICTSGVFYKNDVGKIVGACNGDSGGPLTTLIWGIRRQIGIVSTGTTSSCEAGTPTVYTRVTSFRSWIAANAG